MINKFRVWLIDNKAAFFLFAALIFGASIFYIDTHTSDKFKTSFMGGVLVEAHGMMMDIILFGIILTLYERFTDKRKEIQRLHEEIDDYRGWDEPEAMYRIVGCIKRLNKKGVTKIDLKDCYLKKANLRNANLQGADLQGANLQEADFRVAGLRGANLKDVYLCTTNLQGADLRGADLQYANLERADL